MKVDLAKRSSDFVKAYQAIHSVPVMCRLLTVSASGFYAWDHRALSAHARADIELSVHIHSIHRCAKDAYGVSPFTVRRYTRL